MLMELFVKNKLHFIVFFSSLIAVMLIGYIFKSGIL
jgi:hypothetical protein